MDDIKKLKIEASNKCYNPLAQKAEELIQAIEKLDLLHGNYENLQPIISCFNQVKVKDGYILDGAQDGIFVYYSTNMVLYARKEGKRIPEEYHPPIWDDVTVPFNEDGIWEAVLLYLAPRFMPGYHHWQKAQITPVTSDAILISECRTIDDYYKYLNSALVQPSVSIESDEKAIVSFAAWGWYGLMHWILEVTKDRNTVKIEEVSKPISLLNYKPRIIL